MTDPALVNFAPTLRLALLALALAALPLSWVWLRQRDQGLPARLAALTALTLFLTFDLIVFGAFTRLSDSGLGCPDWPGCYGQATPWGAAAEIQNAQQLAPSGAVTPTKAWIEMIHRYLAMTVGVLILVAAVATWRARKAASLSPWWPSVTLLWVLVQGMFGKFTVTLKLYPAVVSLHLVGGLVLLVLLAWQHVGYQRAQGKPGLQLGPTLQRLLWAASLALTVQIVLGAWVSTNYAVLACTGFPACNGQWWPAMDFDLGFTLLRALGEGGQGRGLTVQALVAIHMAHRLMAVLAVALLLALALALWRHTGGGQRRFGQVLCALLVLQVASGLSNVVLGWPLVAALGHSAGAAALVLLLALLWARSVASEPGLRVAGQPQRPSATLGLAPAAPQPPMQGSKDRVDPG
jgi:heme a synthase